MISRQISYPSEPCFFQNFLADMPPDAAPAPMSGLSFCNPPPFSVTALYTTTISALFISLFVEFLK